LKNGIKAFALIAIIFTIVYLSGIVNFDTNDDLAVISMLKGYFDWGSNIPPFLSPILSMALIKLYSVNYDFPWFSLLQYLTMFICMYWGVKIILSTSWSRLSKIALIMILLSLYSYILIRPNFGATSLFLGFMTSIYVAYLNLKGNGFWLSYLVAGIILSLSYMFKVENILIVLPIIFPVFFTFLLSSDTRNKFFVMLIPIAVAAIVSLLVNSHILDYYYSVHSSMSTFFSFHLNEMPKSLNLNAAGWNYDDYYVASTWFTHDQTIFGSDKIYQFLFYDVFHIFIPYVISQITLIGVVKASMPFVLVILLGLIIILDSNRKPFTFELQKTKVFWIKWLVILSLVTMIGGITALALYRFPPRVFIPLFVYAFFVVLLARSLMMIDKRPIFNNIRKGLLGGILCLIILLLILQIGKYQKVNELMIKYQDNANVTITTIKNMIGDDVIFLDGAGCGASFIFTDPFEETVGVDYSLVVPGWGINTPAYYDFLRRHNIPVSKIVEYSINNQKVVYRFYCPGWESVDVFERHFNKHYGSDTKVLKFEIVKDFRQSDWEYNYLYMRLVQQ